MTEMTKQLFGAYGYGQYYKEVIVMKLNAYSIYDTASGVYQRPFFVGADGEATRMFADLVMEKDHPVGKHPNDYSLFRIGSFNDVSGVMAAEDNGLLECLMTGLQAVSSNWNGVVNEE